MSMSVQLVNPDGDLVAGGDADACSSLMGGLSPNVNSSSFHSSSYLPKMEANFWNNLKCCDTIFGNLHELVQHFETVHKQAPSHLPYSNLPRRKSSSTNPADWNAHGNVRGVQPWAESRLSGMPTSRWAGAYQDTGRKQSTIGMQDMDTIGEMELDDDHTMPGQGFEGFDQQTDGYSSNTTPSIGHAMSDGSLKGDTGSPEHYQGQPSHATYSNNMYSSMSQQLNSHQQQQQMPQMSQMQGYGHMNERLQANGGFQAQHNANAVPFNTQMFDRLSSNFKSMDVGSNNDMRDLCINEPAKNLYADDGTFNSQQYPHFNFGGSMTNGGGEITHNNDENAKKLQAQRLAAGIGKQPTEEERPFKCPVIGCEKAYKNANGLRYHEKASLRRSVL